MHYSDSGYRSSRWSESGYWDFAPVRPATVVEQLEQPILAIHGEDDTVISAEETVELRRISDNREDRVWIVPGAEHINVYRKDADA